MQLSKMNVAKEKKRKKKCKKGLVNGKKIKRFITLLKYVFLLICYIKANLKNYITN